MARIFGYHVVENGNEVNLFRSRQKVATAKWVDDENIVTMMPEKTDSEAKLMIDIIQDEIRTAYERLGAGCPEGTYPTDYLIKDILYLNRSVKSAVNAIPYFEDTLYLNAMVKKRESNKDRGLVVYVSCGEEISKMKASKMEGVLNRWAVFKGQKFNSNSIMLGETPMDKKRGKREKK